MTFANRAVAILLACALGVASAVPVLGTKMRCGSSPVMAGAMTAGSMLADGSICPPCPKCPDEPSAAALRAGSCCRVSTVDQTDAFSATLTVARAASSDDGRALAAATVPSPGSLDGAALAANRPSGGSPPTVSPPNPTRTTVLRN